jgi:hypothetical protein
MLMTGGGQGREATRDGSTGSAGGIATGMQSGGSAHWELAAAALKEVPADLAVGSSPGPYSNRQREAIADGAVSGLRLHTHSFEALSAGASHPAHCSLRPCHCGWAGMACCSAGLGLCATPAGWLAGPLAPPGASPTQPLPAQATSLTSCRQVCLGVAAAVCSCVRSIAELALRLSVDQSCTSLSLPADFLLVRVERMSAAQYVLLLAGGLALLVMTGGLFWCAHRRGAPLPASGSCTLAAHMHYGSNKSESACARLPKLASSCCRPCGY